MMINLVVFDLDGTLVRSHKTIYRATRQALKELNISAEMPEQEFYNMIGLHFEDIFEKFGFAVPDFEQFINVYKSVYFDFINYSVIYPGVVDIFKKLQDNKIKIGLLTTKGQDQAEKIIKHFSLFDNFSYVMGRRPGIAHKPSPEPLLKISDDLNVDNNKILMVGDSEMDIQCGHNAAVRTCGVTYGYRTREELITQKPDFLIDRIMDLQKVLNLE